MKKHLLSFIAIGLSIVAVAQPTLTGSNTNPAIGNTFPLKPGPYVAPGTAGASQTWNFTAWTSTAAVTGNTVAAVTPSLVSQFPTATVQQTGAGGERSFFNATSSSLQNVGYLTGTVSIQYSNPEDQLRYPMTLGTASYTDPFYATFANGGYNFFRYGSTTVVPDAYGTIQLPSGTFSNALRVHFIQDYRDSAHIGTSFDYLIDYYNDMYLWYIPNNHVAVFSTYSITTVVSVGTPGTPQTSTGSNMLQLITTGIADEASTVKSLNFYPNPAANILNLDLNLNENMNYAVVITDNLGREVLRTDDLTGFEGYNFKTLDISGISGGLYNFEIISDNQRLVTKKIVITK